MKLQLRRIKDDRVTTIGLLDVDGVFQCFTVEDAYKEIKVAGLTRIPAGTYTIKLRTVGGMTKRYSDKYSFHEGMLWLQDVPGFTYVYLHIGNTAKHTDGCILLNDGCDSTSGNMGGSKSLSAYSRVYKNIMRVIGTEAVSIEIIDE